MGRGSVTGIRFDVDAYHPGFLGLVNHVDNLPHTAKISEILATSLTSGFAAGKQNRDRAVDTAVPQIRPTQILLDGELDLSNAYGINANDVSERDYLQRGEVLFNNTNSASLVGKSAVFRDSTLAVCSNHVTRIRPMEGVDPEFVALVLNTLQGLGYFASLCTKFNNQAGVNTATLANVRIPLPLPEERERLTSAMDTSRADRKAKLAEAAGLLAGLDGFVLQNLGISLPPSDSKKVFAVQMGYIRSQRRLDPDYYHPERVNALRLLQNTSDNIETATLNEVVTFTREHLPTPTETYLGLAHVQSHTGELADAKETALGTCTAFRLNDILFARLRPYLNKVYRAEMDGSCSTEFHVLRIIDNNLLLPDYLAAILRSRIVLSQTVHMMTGNTHPRLANDDVEHLRIPIPNIQAQEEIVAEIFRRRDRARRLRSEAETSWQEAKRWFEAQLLGNLG